ncbi:MAG: flavin reductase family protein [Phycisphaerales bacterium]
MRELDPERLSTAERYKLLIGGVVPRPIAFVSTVSPDGRANLAPFSFFNAVSSTPMTLMFCPANDANGGLKDSLLNASPPPVGVGSFVVNVATEEYARQVAAAAEPLEHGDSEFELTGLTPIESVAVEPPRVAESPLSFECLTTEVIRLAPDIPAGGNIVLGRVVRVHLREDLVNDRLHVDPERLAAIGRMGGRTYCSTRQRFDLPVGRPALNEPPPSF